MPFIVSSVCSLVQILRFALKLWRHRGVRTLSRDQLSCLIGLASPFIGHSAEDQHGRPSATSGCGDKFGKRCRAVQRC